ncbi:MAG: radical SAM protein, partial [Flavicella sp.]|nr:radical SAM protein [Flavicella sp.]
MSGIYIHIPFCKQACHYCDFHFSTSLKNKEAMLGAIQKELIQRSDDFKKDVIETIYFGGGTPSLLSQQEIDALLEVVYSYFEVVKTPEITLEANPDDLNSETIKELAQSKVNRLSIGVQSFF